MTTELESGTHGMLAWKEDFDGRQTAHLKGNSETTLFFASREGAGPRWRLSGAFVRNDREGAPYPTLEEAKREAERSVELWVKTCGVRLLARLQPPAPQPLSKDDIHAVETLARMVKLSRQNLGIRLLDAADIVLRVVEAIKKGRAR